MFGIPTNIHSVIIILFGNKILLFDIVLLFEVWHLTVVSNIIKMIKHTQKQETFTLPEEFATWKDDGFIMMMIFNRILFCFSKK